ncbi:MAG: penicillin-binding transpeptidase domain-containing protein [Thermodesulfobacteriota bacterium]
MKESPEKSGKRILPLVIGLVIFFVCLLFLAPLIRGSFFKGRAEKGSVMGRLSGFEPGKDNSGRYKIMDRGYREMAVSFMMNSLYARPLEIDDLPGTAAYLAANLGLDEKELIRDLRAERGFVWLGRRLPESSSAAILKKSLKGVYAVKEAQRYYPGGTSGAHLVGFIEEGNGLAGVESFYDTMLGGGFGLGNGGKERQRGHLVLTIDLEIQKMMEEKLAALQQETGAVSATGLLMNAKDGSILAMASLPGFDANRYWESTKEERLNRTVKQSIKTDSLQQFLAFAAEYDRLASGEQDPLAAVKRDLQLDKNPVRRSHQWFREVGGRYLSPELLAWPAEMQSDERNLDGFVNRLGLYGRSGVDLPGGELGAGQRAGMTSPLQMVAALSSLFNGGRKVSPHLGLAVLAPQKGTLEEIEYPGGEVVVRPETAKKVVDILVASSLSPAGTVVAESLEITGPQPEEPRPAAEKVAAEDSDEDIPASYRTMLVSFSTGRESRLAMYISLEEAVVATGEKTPMRIAGELLMARAQEVVGLEVEKPGLQSLALREVQIYDDWLKSRLVGKMPVAARVAEGQTVMPDLKGLSVRKALRILQPFDLKVKVVGSGRIVAQLPQPGLNIGKGECVLTLQSDN